MAYPAYSPYALTKTQNDGYLGVMVNRPIPFTTTDILWEITATYNYRPDLLAHDLYSDSRLWWIFMQRNPDIILDPINDFTTGTKIYLPKKSTLVRSLGI